MTQEEKKLLLRDLCARLPYQPICEFTDTEDDFCTATAALGYSLRDFIAGKVLIKPYLRPMSSMTEEEENDLKKITWQFNFDRKFNCLWVGAADDGGCMLSEMTQIITYLISHHFDYNGLISMGLALEAPEGMYNNK